MRLEEIIARAKEEIFHNMAHSSSCNEDERKKEINELTKQKAEDYNKLKGDLEGYDCFICNNKGNISKLVEVNGFLHEKLHECECMKKRRNIWRLEESGLKELVERCSFDSFQAKTSWQADILLKAKGFANSPKGWFYIGGQVGAGKTHLCTGICSELIEKGKDVRYMLWRDDIMAIKLNMTEDYSERLEELKTTEVLYIDDFFKGRKGEEPTSSDVNIAFEIINYRYINNLTTIISSEKSIDDVIEIDEALGSRILQKASNNSIILGKDKQKNYRRYGEQVSFEF